MAIGDSPSLPRMAASWGTGLSGETAEVNVTRGHEAGPQGGCCAVNLKAAISLPAYHGRDRSRTSGSQRGNAGSREFCHGRNLHVQFVAGAQTQAMTSFPVPLTVTAVVLLVTLTAAALVVSLAAHTGVAL